MHCSHTHTHTKREREREKERMRKQTGKERKKIGGNKENRKKNGAIHGYK